GPQQCSENMSRAASLDLLRQRLRQIEQPARHGVLPFGVAALDCALPGGGLALGAVHEILGAGGDEEDGAAAAGFAAGILARLTPPPPPPPAAIAAGPPSPAVRERVTKGAVSDSLPNAPPLRPLPDPPTQT